MYYIHPLPPQEIISIYTQIAPLHFPAEELRPLSGIQSLLDRNGYSGLGLFRKLDEENSILIGYALFIQIPGAPTVLLDYFAILEPYRGLGLGSSFIAQMKEHYSNIQGILLETEDFDEASTDDERNIRKQRDAFYCKNGARRTSIKSTVYDVPFQIFFIPSAITLSEKTSSSDSPFAQTAFEESGDNYLRHELDAIYRFMLTPENYNAHVRWRS